MVVKNLMLDDSLGYYFNSELCIQQDVNKIHKNTMAKISIFGSKFNNLSNILFSNKLWKMEN
jgi:hypothetical protein